MRMLDYGCGGDEEEPVTSLSTGAAANGPSVHYISLSAVPHGNISTTPMDNAEEARVTAGRDASNRSMEGRSDDSDGYSANAPYHSDGEDERGLEYDEEESSSEGSDEGSEEDSSDTSSTIYSHGSSGEGSYESEGDDY